MTSIGDVLEAAADPDRRPSASVEVVAGDDEFTFELRALSFRQWADLLAAHPPTAAQQKDLPNADHNPDTFPPAVLAATCVEPVMTVEQAAELLDGLHPSQRDKLWMSALILSRGDIDRPKRSRPDGHDPHLNVESDAPPPTLASPVPSSLGE